MTNPEQGRPRIGLSPEEQQTFVDTCRALMPPMQPDIDIVGRMGATATDQEVALDQAYVFESHHTDAHYRVGDQFVVVREQVGHDLGMMHNVEATVSSSDLSDDGLQEIETERVYTVGLETSTASYNELVRTAPTRIGKEPDNPEERAKVIAHLEATGELPGAGFDIHELIMGLARDSETKEALGMNIFDSQRLGEVLGVLAKCGPENQVR